MRVEGERSFVVEIASVSPSSVISCSASTETTVHILDNDSKIAQLSELTYTY